MKPQLFSIHTVLPSVTDVSGAILSIILPNFCLLCVFVCVHVVAKGDSEKDKNTKMGLYNRGLLKNLIKPRLRELNY